MRVLIPIKNILIKTIHRDPNLCYSHIDFKWGSALEDPLPDILPYGDSHMN